MCSIGSHGGYQIRSKTVSLIPLLHDTTGCQTGYQTGLTTGLATVLNEKPLFYPIYTIQPVVRRFAVVKPVVNRVERTATVCSTGLNEQPLFVQPVVKPGCTTGLTTGCIHDTASCQTVAWAEVYLRTKWHLDPSSHLATTDMGHKLGRGAVPLWGRVSWVPI